MNSATHAYLRKKYNIPNGVQIIIKQGQAEIEKGPVTTVLAIAALTALLAAILSGCDETGEVTERENQNAEHISEIRAILEQLIEDGVEFFEVIGSGNENICDFCAEIAGSVFHMDELVIGETAPPFHPNCGCSIRAVESDSGQTERPLDPPPGALGERTENNIAALHPYLQEAARRMLWEMQHELADIGNARIIEAYRSVARQNEVFDSGASRVRGGFSYHQYGLAFDIGFFDGNIFLTNIDWPTWQRVGEIGRRHGFEWGGDWTSFVDPPHFQMVFGHTTSELMNMPLLESSDYLRQLDPNRRHLPQPTF